MSADTTDYTGEGKKEKREIHKEEGISGVAVIFAAV
jgi:hypothetical protein